MRLVRHFEFETPVLELRRAKNIKNTQYNLEIIFQRIIKHDDFVASQGGV